MSLSPTQPVEFTVPGLPVSWKRMRQKGTQRFPDRDSADFKGKVAVFASKAIPKPHEGPVALVLRFFWPPRNPPRKREPRPQEWYTTRNRHDLDRLQSNIFDALNGVAYIDDGQVVSVLAQKFRAAQGDPPRVEIQVVPL